MQIQNIHLTELQKSWRLIPADLVSERRRTSLCGSACVELRVWELPLPPAGASTSCPSQIPSTDASSSHYCCLFIEYWPRILMAYSKTKHLIMSQRHISSSSWWFMLSVKSTTSDIVKMKGRNISHTDEESRALTSDPEAWFWNLRCCRSESECRYATVQQKLTQTRGSSFWKSALFLRLI